MDTVAIEYAQYQEEIANKLNKREFEENSDRKDSETRNSYSRDYARVLYSSSFRRLQGKMQLLGIDETRFNRNRLTHSLEVAQLSRSIARSLGLKETIVSETCALIHDIGNPPFGHSGELILNELAKEVGGYEGNAQALRVIRSLEKKLPNQPGLNLTQRTLWGTVKYFHAPSEDRSKFLYQEDYDFIKHCLDSAGIDNVKSIDAQIMDISDEIAYAAHDLEDALSSNYIAIGELIHEFKISEKYNGSYEQFKEIVQRVQKIANESSQLSTSEEYSIIFKKELTSAIVNALVTDIGLVKSESNQDEIGYKSLSNLALGLKHLTFSTILRKQHIQDYEARGEKVIRGLFEVYSDEKFNRKMSLLPAELRTRKDDPKRKICDYISGMMDAFAAKEFVRYFGKSNYEALYKKKGS